MDNLDKLPDDLLPKILSLFDLSSLAQFRTISKEKQLLVDNQYPLRPIFQEIMSEPLTPTSNIIEIRSQIQKKINAIHYDLTVLSDNLKVQDLNHHLLKFLHVFLIKTAQILISNTNFNDYQTSITMHDIIRHLISSEFVEKAIGFSHAIPSNYIKSTALHDIIRHLISSERFEEAINISHAIYSKHIESTALHNIIRHLISSERFEEAIGISHTIPDDSQKNFALQWIVMTLTSTSFYRAIIVAHMIEDPDIRTSTLEEIDAI